MPRHYRLDHIALHPQKRGYLLGTGTGGGDGGRAREWWLDRGRGEGRENEDSTADTALKRPERPWTAARTMEVLRRCPLAIKKRLVHCAVPVSTAVLDRVTRTMSVALLLRNNPKRKKSNFSQPSSTSLLLISSGLTWGSSSTSLLLISPGTL